MHVRGILACLLIFVTAAFTRAAEPGPGGADHVSIEALAVLSDLVAVGRVVEASPAGLRIKTDETLRGLELDVIRLAWPADEPPPETGTNVMLFASRVSDGSGLVWYARRLVRLDGEQIRSMAMCSIGGRDQLVAAVREIGDIRAPLVGMPGVAGHSQSAALVRAAQGRMPRGLLVPRIPALERMAHGWLESDDIVTRCIGVSTLGHFRSNDNIDRLTRALADTGFTPAGHQRWPVAEYPVRRLAHHFLADWKAPVDAPTFRGMARLHHPFNRRTVAWVTALAVVGAVVIGLLAGDFRRRSTGLESRWTHRAAAGMTGLCLLILLGSLLLRGRSMRIADELVFHAGGLRHELASYKGSIQWVRVTGWPDSTDAGYGRFDLTPAVDRWSLNMLSPTWKRSRGGFLLANGPAFAGPARLNYRLIQIPLWPIILAAFIFPARGLLVLLRQWRRHRTGACLACGYDTRATPGNCSECGWTQLRRDHEQVVTRSM